MNIHKLLILLITLGLLLLAVPVLGADLTIIAPYYGTENNTYIDNQYGLELKDSSPMKGMYIQSIDFKKYQWNLFIYQTDDINYSDISGVNFIYDRYFGSDESGKYVFGVGMNYLDINMAGSQIPTAMGPLDGFDMDLAVSSLYLRFGKYVNLGQTSDPVHLTILPWIGGELDHSRGTGLVDFPGPGSVGFQINDDQYSWIAGINFRLTIYHFIDIEAKHMITYNHDQCYNKSTALVNLFFSRNLGLSYRYNIQEDSMGKDSYGLWGIVFMY